MYLHTYFEKNRENEVLETFLLFRKAKSNCRIFSGKIFLLSWQNIATETSSFYLQKQNHVHAAACPYLDSILILHILTYFNIFPNYYRTYFHIKGSFSWDLESGHELKLFPANIWIFKLFFLMVFAIKMLLDKIYGFLNLVEV